MLKVKTKHQPHLNKINKKFYPVINKIIEWSNAICISLNCNVFGIYIRGSVAHGCENKNSDLDIVILLSNSHLSNNLRFNDTIDSLTALYVYPYRIDVNVFSVNFQLRVNPPITGCLKEIASKHLNFDICANGVCFWGNEINQFDIFESCEDFRENNILVRGALIKELIYNMENNEFFNDYYQLIKECIRLAAYIHFKSNSLYSSLIADCFAVAVATNVEIKDELGFLFKFVNQPIMLPFDEIGRLKKSIIIVATFILKHQIIR